MATAPVLTAYNSEKHLSGGQRTEILGESSYQKEEKPSISRFNQLRRGDLTFRMMRHVGDVVGGLPQVVDETSAQIGRLPPESLGYDSGDRAVTLRSKALFPNPDEPTTAATQSV